MLRLASLLALLAALAGPVAAHHTYVQKYDPGRVIKLDGTIETVSYTNPHVFFTVSVKGQSWTIETESIPKISGKGLTKALLKEGAKISIQAWPARDGGAQAGLKIITFSGGPTIQILKSPR